MDQWAKWLKPTGEYRPPKEGEWFKSEVKETLGMIFRTNSDFIEKDFRAIYEPIFPMDGYIDHLDLAGKVKFVSIRELEDYDIYWCSFGFCVAETSPVTVKGAYPVYSFIGEKIKTDKQSEDKPSRYIVQDGKFYKWTREYRLAKKGEYLFDSRSGDIRVLVSERDIRECPIYVKFDPHGDLEFAYQETKKKIKKCREAGVGDRWAIWMTERYPYIAMIGSGYCAFCQVLDEGGIKGDKAEVICKSKCPLGNGLCSYLMGNVRHAFCDTILDSFEKGLDEWHSRWRKEKEMISSTKESWESNMGRRVESLETGRIEVLKTLDDYRFWKAGIENWEEGIEKRLDDLKDNVKLISDVLEKHRLID